jgi:hypothetical protein
MVLMMNSEVIARLRVTLQRPPSKGGSETAYVVYPNTYEVNITLSLGATEISHQCFLFQEAVDVVHEVYNLGARSVKKEDITLCCLSTRHIGYDQQFMWASIIPREWGAIVRPHVDEVGVFLEQDRNEWGGVVSFGKRVRYTSLSLSFRLHFLQMLGPAKSLLGLLAIGYALRRN